MKFKRGCHTFFLLILDSLLFLVIIFSSFWHAALIGGEGKFGQQLLAAAVRAAAAAGQVHKEEWNVRYVATSKTPLSNRLFRCSSLNEFRPTPLDTS